MRDFCLDQFSLGASAGGGEAVLTKFRWEEHSLWVAGFHRQGILNRLRVEKES